MRPSPKEGSLPDRVAVGVIGTGWGQVLIRAFQADPRTEVAAVCSTDVSRARDIADAYGVRDAYGDYRELLADPAIDAVAIITNPGTHSQIALAALDAGKHVLCAKPLGRTLDEAKEVWLRAHDSKLIHAMDLPGRVNPANAQLRQIIRSGLIGQPLTVSAASAMYLPSYFARGYFQFDERLTLPRASPNKGAWFGKQAAGGGLLFAVTPHTIDRLLDLFGPVRRVSARTHTAQPEVRSDDGNVYECDAIDSYHAVLEFESGMTGLLQGTPLGWNGLLTRFEVHGSAGSILEESTTSGRKQFGRRMVAHADGGGYVDLPAPPPLPIDSAVAGAPPTNVALAARFVTAVIRGEQMRPNFEDGYRVQELIEAMIRSSETGLRQELASPFFAG